MIIKDSIDRRSSTDCARTSCGRRIVDQTSIIKDKFVIIHKRNLVSRIYVVVSILVTLILLLTTEQYKIDVIKSEVGLFLIWALLGVCSIATLDIFFNDILPRNYYLLWLYNKRHITYMVMAIGMYGITAAIILTNDQATIMIRMWLDGFFATMVAVLDVLSRHRGTPWHSGK